MRLNPFMNQVYFYYPVQPGDRLFFPSLNPFMNQVYFYFAASAIRSQFLLHEVLIPL